MAINVGINGYGRIGRNVLRALYESKRNKELRIVAVNDLGDARTNAHLTRRDTAHGPFPGTIEVDGDSMVVNGDRIRVLAERDPSKLPWKELGVDVVLEMSGIPAAIHQGFAMVRRGGRVQMLGIPSRPMEVNFANEVIFKGITVYGVIGRRMYDTWHQMTRFLLSGEFDPSPVITHRFPLEGFEEAMRVIKSGEAGKVIFEIA